MNDNANTGAGPANRQKRTGRTTAEGDNDMKTVRELRDILTTRKDRSAWDKGVTLYAIELLDNFTNDDYEVYHWQAARDILLDGAHDWRDYSHGGCALVYDGDIAERLCCASELKRTRSGERRPSGCESWLDVQGRALFQACERILDSSRK